MPLQSITESIFCTTAQLLEHTIISRKPIRLRFTRRPYHVLPEQNPVRVRPRYLLRNPSTASLNAAGC